MAKGSYQYFKLSFYRNEKNLKLLVELSPGIHQGFVDTDGQLEPFDDPRSTDLRHITGSCRLGRAGVSLGHN